MVDLLAFRYTNGTGRNFQFLAGTQQPFAVIFVK